MAAQVSFTIMNVGNEAASATSAVQFFASIDGTLTGAISLGSQPLPVKLKAGASHVYKAKLTLAAGVLVPGTYKLLALLDPNNMFNDPNAATNFIVSGNTFSVT